MCDNPVHLYINISRMSTHLCCITHVRIKMNQTRPVSVFGPENDKDILASQAATPVFSWSAIR
jgi:hypothetical protein